MGVIEWFLGTHFSWRHNNEETAAHLNQAGFSRNLVEHFNIQDRNINSFSTPYRSGQPIDSIKQGDPDDTSPAQENCTHACQSLVGSIGWLTQMSCPDLAAVHSFLASYTKCPSPGHMKLALYAHQYIHSTHDYDISFTSKAKRPMQTYLHQPHETGMEAFEDAVAPTPKQSHRVTTYIDANWGSQIGNALRKEMPVPLLKLRSMSGAMMFRMNGPLAWKTERQPLTSLSSCEAEINATNLMLGSPITDSKSGTSQVEPNHNKTRNTKIPITKPNHAPQVTWADIAREEPIRKNDTTTARPQDSSGWRGISRRYATRLAGLAG